MMRVVGFHDKTERRIVDDEVPQLTGFCFPIKIPVVRRSETINELREKDSVIAVLIVDSNDTVREQLSRWLRHVKGFQVDSAASGEEAIERVHGARGDYNAIVMDQDLPGMRGIEAMKQLRADYPSLLILMFAGRDPEAGVEALKQGAYRYLLKPVLPRNWP